PRGKDRIIVTLMQRRTYQVLVVREEGSSSSGDKATKRGTGHAIDLPAYENDVLHALNETGGLPGLDAENEVIIQRGLFNDGVTRDDFLADINAASGMYPDMPLPDHPNVTPIPPRYYPDHP